MTAMNAQRDVLGLLAGKPLPIDERDKILDDMVALFIAEERKRWETVKKARKKAELHPQAQSVYDAYPRHEGGTNALRFITKAIDADGLELVMTKTKEYAKAVSHWQPNRKQSANGASTIPMPATWYGNRRYMDNSKEWWAGTGASLAKADAAERKVEIPEPNGWRFLHPESRFVKENIQWQEMDDFSKNYIISTMPKEHTA